MSSRKRPNRVVRVGEVRRRPSRPSPARSGSPARGGRLSRAAWPGVGDDAAGWPARRTRRRPGCTRPRSTSAATCRLTVEGSACTRSASAPWRSGPRRTSGKSSTSAARSPLSFLAACALSAWTSRMNRGTCSERARTAASGAVDRVDRAGRARRGWTWALRTDGGKTCTVQPVARCTQSVAPYTDRDPRDVARRAERAVAILDAPSDSSASDGPRGTRARP